MALFVLMMLPVSEVILFKFYYSILYPYLGGHYPPRSQLLSEIVVVFLLVPALSITFVWGLLMILRPLCDITMEISLSGISVNYNSINDEESGGSSSKRKLLTKEKVLELDTFRYTEKKTAVANCDIENQNDSGKGMCGFNSTCSICIDDFEENELLRALPCGHLYHTHCVMPWLTTRSPNCPLCKECIIIEEEDDPKSV